MSNFHRPQPSQGFTPYNPSAPQQQQPPPNVGPTPGGMNIRPPQQGFPPQTQGPPGSMMRGPAPPGAAMQGPPGGMMQGPPGSAMRGPPGSAMQGPPGSAMRGPPGAMQGPPGSSMQGPPGSSMQAPPGPGAAMRGPPVPPTSSMQGPPSGGPPTQGQGFGAGPPSMGSPPTSTFSPRNLPPPPSAAQVASRAPPGQGPPTQQFSQMGLAQQQPSGGYQQPQAGGYQQPIQYGGQPQYGQPQQQPMQAPVLSEAALAAQCDPKYMRMTVNAIPHSQEHASKSHLSFGVIIQPMAPEVAEPLEVVNFGSSGVVRCKRCRTYINPFVQWVDNGRRWRCNVCGIANDVPSSYFCHLGPDQQRQDVQERPELRSGSCEVVAPADYMMRPPQPPVYVFVIDVSTNAMQSGMLQVCIDTIKAQLDNLPGSPRTRVGFLTYDSAVHFYNLKSSLNVPQLMVVPDISELFIPIPDDLLVNLSESRAVIDALLEMLPSMHKNSKNVETALGPAIRAAFRVMSSVGGKMCVFQSTLPSLGQGALKHRENARLFGTDKEHQLLTSAEPFYRQNAIEFSRQQVSVDLFLLSHQYADVATLGTLSKFSAGQVYHYPNFTVATHGDKFRAELTHCLTREQGWEAVMRVRCTQGMRLSNFYGNSFMRGTDLLALPNCNSDSTFAIEIVHSDSLLTATIVTVQAALLYTTSCGERRIRVLTMAVPVTKLYAEVFRAADVDSMCNLMAKCALEKALKTGLGSARQALQQQCADIVRAYRSSGAYGSQHGQVNLPESLQLLPLYVMALIKNPTFRGGLDVKSDERVFLSNELNNMPVDQSRVFIYPRLFSLHNLAPECGLPVPEEKSSEDIPTAGKTKVQIPAVLNLSIDRLSSEGIFLLEDSLTLYVWFGRAAAPELLQKLFGLNSLDGIDCSQLQLRSQSNDYSKRVVALIGALREDRQPYMNVQILREGDPGEARFFWKLIEDRASFNGGSYSYSEFLGHVHRQSQGVGS